MQFFVLVENRKSTLYPMLFLGIFPFKLNPLQRNIWLFYKEYYKKTEKCKFLYLSFAIFSFVLENPEREIEQNLSISMSGQFHITNCRVTGISLSALVLVKTCVRVQVDLQFNTGPEPQIHELNSISHQKLFKIELLHLFSTNWLH